MKAVLCVCFCSFLILRTHAQDLNPAELVERFSPAVVVISSVKDGQQIGQGSGFIVKDTGVIITNFHVIDGAYPVEIKLKSGDTFEEVSVIDFSARHDIAVLKIKGFDLPTVELGNSNKVRVGEAVTVIGNPLGYEGSVSSGLLSQVRNFDGYHFHQISAPISPGSSGSPVFNAAGQVIGVATATDIEGQNINFSVPINYARGMIDQPVQYDLKELSAADRPQTVSAVREKKVIVDEEKFLKELNGAINLCMLAADNVKRGYAETTKPHLRRFYPRKFQIDYRIYSAQKAMSAAHADLDKIASDDADLTELKSTMVQIIDEGNRSIKEVLGALGNRETDNRTGFSYSVPLWNKAIGAFDAFIIAMMKADRDFVLKYFQRIEKYPDIRVNVLQGFLRAYEDRDMTEKQKKDRYANRGRMGIWFWDSAQANIIMQVVDGGAASKARLRPDDMILGVHDGQRFVNQMDMFRWLYTTKSGQRVKLDIEREGRVITKRLKLQ
jgi:S1-C subfamily serine protease